MRQLLSIILLLLVACDSEQASLQEYPLPTQLRELQPMLVQPSYPSTGDAAMPAPLADATTSAIGSLPGRASVTAGGAATYTIPLELPPGRNGMQPSIALTYSSQTPNGQLGVGFSLSGVSSEITPCPKTLSQDGQLLPVRWNPNTGNWADRLCLDGQRLVLKSGTYATDGAEYRTERDSLQKIVQVGTPATHFLVYTRDGRILRYGDNPTDCASCNGRMAARDGMTRAWALVQTEDRYGNRLQTFYTRIDASADSEDYDLDGVEDYTGAPEVKEYYPSKIQYTSGNGQAYHAEVRFYYDSSRPDTSTGWFAGIRDERTVRLTSIRTYALNQEVRRYVLNYEISPDTQSSRISKVTECVSGGTICKPSTSFEWTKGSGSYKRYATSIAAPAMSVKQPTTGTDTPLGIVSGDFNGDGRSDLFYPKVTCTTTTCTGTWRLLIAGDSLTSGAVETTVSSSPTWPFLAVPLNYNNDSNTDVLLLDGSSTWKVFVSGQSLVDTGLSKRQSSGFGLVDTYLKRNLIADFTGDGLQDIIACQPRATDAATWRWSLRTNTGAGGTSGSFSAETELPTGYGGGSDCRNDSTLVLDANGDGAMDLLRTVSGQATYEATLLTSNPNGLMQTQLPSTVGQIGEAGRQRLIDLNGDGLLDIYTTTGLPGAQGRYWLNLGNRFAGGTDGYSNLITDQYGNNIDYGQYQDSLAKSNPLDHDGDGSEDLFLDGNVTPMYYCHMAGTPANSYPDCPPLRPAPPTWEVLVNTGKNRMTPLNTGISYQDNGKGQGYARAHTLDDNGDLIPDLVIVEADVFKVIRHSGDWPDKVQRIREGQLGLTSADPAWSSTYSVGFEYASSAQNSGVYGAGLVGVSAPSCAYPVRCGNPMSLLVRSHFLQNGTSANPVNRYDHTYFDARRDRKGRGNLGFGQHRIEEYDNGGAATYTLERYDNYTYDSTYKRYPFRGQLRSSIREFGAVPPFGGRQIILTSLTLDKKDEAIRGSAWPGYLPFVSSTEIRVHELNTDATSSASASNLVSWVKSTRTVDNYGTPLLSSTYVDNVLYEISSNDGVVNDEARWLLGQVTATSRTSYAESPAVTRLSSRKYDASTGAVLTSRNEEGLTSSFSYDVFGNLKSATLTAGGVSRTTSIAYDSRSIFPYYSVNALGHISRTSFDYGRGVLLTSVDGNLLATRFSYDLFGRLRKLVRPDNTEVTTTYLKVDDTATAFHTEVATHQAGVSGVSQRLDRLGRVVQTVRDGFGDEGVYSETVYDRFGGVASVSAPHFSSEVPAIESYAYDRAGRLCQTTRPWGAVRQINRMRAPNATQRLVAVEDEVDNWNSQRINSLGQVVRSDFTTDSTGQNPANGFMTFTYGAFGAPRTSTNALGHVTTTTSDRYNRPLTITDANIGKRTFTYDAFGQRTSETDATGSVIKMSYDLGGRMIQRVTDQGTATWTYDTASKGLGQLAAVKHVVNGSSFTSETRTYDAYGRASGGTVTVGGKTASFQWTYDAYGRMASHTTITPAPATSFSLLYGYDDYGNLTRISNASGQGWPYWELNGVNGQGQIASETFGNGITTAREYDDTKGLLTHVSAQGALELSFVYDDKGRLTGRSDHLQNQYQSFGYDALDQLKWGKLCANSVTACSSPTTQFKYSYDLIGNLTVVNASPYVYDPQRPQLLTSTGDGSTFLYDANGRMTNRDGVSISYAWNDLPTSIYVYNDTQDSGSTEIYYNAAGSAVLKTGIRDGMEFASYYFSDGYELDASASTPIHRFKIRAEGRTIALVTRTGSTDSISYFHGDHLDSTEVTTDAVGSATSRVKFQPFGMASASKWNGASTDLTQPVSSEGFTGHRHDVATVDGLELIDMKGRIYDPTLQRFLTPDPLVQAPYDRRSHHRFSYVWNNPLNNTDPTGFETETETMEPEISVTGTRATPEERDSWCAQNPGECPGEATETDWSDRMPTNTRTPQHDGSQGREAQVVTYGSPSSDFAVGFFAEAYDRYDTFTSNPAAPLYFLPQGALIYDLVEALGLTFERDDISNAVPNTMAGEGGKLAVTAVDMIVTRGGGLEKAAGKVGLKAAKEATLAAEPTAKLFLATNKEARAAAKANGWKEVKGARSNEQPVFTDGKKFFSADVGSGNGAGSHNGGVWKRADSVKNLGKKETREGTFDADLRKIGD